MVARFGLVMVGFGGGHLGVGWVSQWRLGLRLGFWGWVTVEIGLWVTAWLESVGVGFCGLILVFRWCGSALGLLWW